MSICKKVAKFLQKYKIEKNGERWMVNSVQVNFYCQVISLIQDVPDSQEAKAIQNMPEFKELQSIFTEEKLEQANFDEN